jgi:serine/threonine protein kinase
VPAITQYELLGVLGEGASGVVHRARRRATGELVAIKVARGLGHAHVSPSLSHHRSSASMPDAVT